MTMRLYIAQINFNGWLDNLYFEGLADAATETAFELARRTVFEMIKKHTIWADYRAAAITTFKEHGFQPIKK